MAKNVVLWALALSSTLLGGLFHAQVKTGADSSKKAMTSTLIVKVEDKKTTKPVKADVIVYWGDFKDESKSKREPTLEGKARLDNVPRGKAQIQVVADGYVEPYTCLYEIKKAEESIGIQLEDKRWDKKPLCPVLPRDSKK